MYEKNAEIELRWYKFIKNSIILKSLFAFTPSHLSRVHINIHNACTFEIRHFQIIRGFEAASTVATENPRNLFMTFSTETKNYLILLSRMFHKFSKCDGFVSNFLFFSGKLKQFFFDIFEPVNPADKTDDSIYFWLR